MRPLVLHVVGERPNFMKIAPVMRAIERADFADVELVHTGQHYDAAMSDVFFTDLGMPRPDHFLGVGSGSHAEQTARVMVELEKILLLRRPAVVVVAGDVNSTLAAAIDCAKLRIPCAHVESGLRSNDWSMPEEVNRVLTDRVCEILLTPSRDGDENLRREGTPEERIFFVGNTMIDSLLAHLPRARATSTLADLGLVPGGYAVLTLHRPSNVDDPAVLARLLDGIEAVERRLTVVFPVHPRTRKQLEAFGLGERLAALPRLRLVDPLGYLEFLALTSQARLVLTDSGGIQEETTALSVPCLTLRENTERPVTLPDGRTAPARSAPVCPRPAGGWAGGRGHGRGSARFPGGAGRPLGTAAGGAESP